MKNEKLISIIIPVYNDNKRLKTCLQSISKQGSYLSETEVIVVDNASKESPKKILSQFPFAKYSYEEKPGSYAARNKGVSIASGNYLVFLDADCIPIPTWLDNGMSCLNSSLKHTLIGGKVHLPLPSKPTITELYQCTVGFQQKENIEEKSFSATANLFIKTEDALNIGPFDERILSGGDRDWCLKAVNKGMKIHYCPKAIINTPARKYLSDAITQARRVAEGRFHYKALKLTEHPSRPDTTFKPHRSSLQSIRWILQQSHLTCLQRLQILFIAIVLKIVTIIEHQRLKLGFTAERS